MTRNLSNKQVAVLEELRRHPDGCTAQKIADKVTGPRVPCPDCDGTGEPQAEDFEQAAARSRRLGIPDHEHRPARSCRKCYGRGERQIPYMDYPTAYQALQRLVRLGLADRRQKLDEWGDPTPGVVYLPTDEPDATDPLEQLWRAPTAAEPR